MARRYFGTDGIRGRAGVCPLDPETLVRLGKACAKMFLKGERKHRILIAKDTRLSGYMIENSLAAGMTAMGIDVMFTGPVPTAGLAYLTKSMRVDAGVMISASHNSYEDNGIKIFAPDGYKLPDEQETELERLMESVESRTSAAEPHRIGKAWRIDDALGRYTVFLKGCFPPKMTLDGIKIGLDCAHGAAYVVAPQTFVELGADVVCEGIAPNGRNINCGFGSTFPEVAQKIVLNNKLDIGIALDGDADRAVLIDELGNIIDGDQILAICAADLIAEKRLINNVVVGTIMTNGGLVEYLKNNNVNFVAAPVGDRYVLEKMLEHGAILGGEQSGHTMFLDQTTTGDGILAALTVLSIMIKKGCSLSKLTGLYKPFPQKLISFAVKAKPKLETLPAIANAIQATEAALQKSGGKLLVRYSGTENKIRILTEARDSATADKHAKEIAELIRAEIGA